VTPKGAGVGEPVRMVQTNAGSVPWPARKGAFSAAVKKKLSLCGPSWLVFALNRTSSQKPKFHSLGAALDKNESVIKDKGILSVREKR
jgi:hypothetical protein